MKPIDIAYKTTIEIERTGPVGKTLRWIGHHPIWGGLICGVVVVAIAALRRPDGVLAEPVTAAIISSFVVGTWMVLFFLMRNFFESQSYRAQTVLRQIVIDDEQAQWLQNEEPKRQITTPTLKVLTNPVPQGLVEHKKGSTRKATAWPVWIVITGDGDERLVFETRDPARRAQDYGEVTDDIIDATDERLPRAIAAPMLPEHKE